MDVVWIALGATVAAVAVAATIMRFVAAAHRAPTNADLGNVSEGWLSENRTRKEP